MQNDTTLTVDDKVHTLIDDLRDGTAKQHKYVRHELVDIGPAAVPGLIEALQSPEVHVRWEAARVLGELRDPEAAGALVAAMQDPDIGVRWTAMESLIAMRRQAMRPLLQALTTDFGSVWLREGAHHILHHFKKHGMLTIDEMKVLDALEGLAPATETPWLAQRALDELK